MEEGETGSALEVIGDRGLVEEHDELLSVSASEGRRQVGLVVKEVKDVEERYTLEATSVGGLAREKGERDGDRREGRSGRASQSNSTRTPSYSNPRRFWLV